jgi:cytidylate kinase
MNPEKKEAKIIMVSGKARHGKDTICDFIREYYNDRGLKTLNLQYSSYIKEYAKKISGWDGSDDTKPRELLQQLGTEVIRNKIDPLFFVKRIIGDIRVYSYFFDLITISDGRAKVEIDIPKKELNNVIAIRINRPNFDNGLTEEQKNHFTEIDLDDYDNYDYVIENDGTIEELKKKVLDIIKEVENEH